MPKISVGESFTVAIISNIEKVWIRGGEYQGFPWKIFFLTVPKISVGETFTFAIISGIEKIRIRKGEYQDFSWKTFCLTVPKNFVVEPFSVSLISGTEKVWIREGGEYQDFPSKLFCLTVPKISVGESFTVAIISNIEKVWIRGGSIKVFREKFFFHSAEKYRRETFKCFTNFGYRKSLDRGGKEYQDFPSEFFCLTVLKISVGESFTVAIISGIEKI